MLVFHVEDLYDADSPMGTLGGFNSGPAGDD